MVLCNTGNYILSIYMYEVVAEVGVSWCVELHQIVVSYYHKLKWLGLNNG